MAWDAVAQAVEAEALAPLLYRILRGRAIVPAALEARWQSAHQENFLRNTLRFHELGGALRRLAVVDVPVILLKGAALAETVYGGNIAARPMADLDLLVHRADAPAALTALESLGYEAVDAEARGGAAIEFENEVMLRKPGRLETLLEVHWSLLDSPHYQALLPMPWFWDTALPVQVDGLDALSLGPEAQILHLCAHLALHHGGRGLLWQHDIAEVLHFYEDRLDWDLLLAKAVECDLLLSLQQVLPPIAEGWAVPAPVAALERLSCLKPSQEETRVFGLLTAGDRPVARRFYADLATTPGWRQRLRYGLISLFPEPSYMRERYHISHPLLLPLYYPYRWLLGLCSAFSIRPLACMEKGDLAMSKVLRSTFLVHATVALVLGVLLLIIPGRFLEALGWAPIDPIISRLLGAALLALAWSSFRSWRAADRAHVAIVLEAEAVFTVLGSMAVLRHLAVANYPSMVWLLFLVLLAFAVSWVYALVRK